MGTYHVLASCMLLYVSLTCNLVQNYYKKKKKPNTLTTFRKSVKTSLQVHFKVVLALLPTDEAVWRCQILAACNIVT